MLSQYIIEYLNANKDKCSKEQLKKDLFSSGYKEKEINKAIKIVYKKEDIKDKRTFKGKKKNKYLLIFSIPTIFLVGFISTFSYLNYKNNQQIKGVEIENNRIQKTFNSEDEEKEESKKESNNNLNSSLTPSENTESNSGSKLPIIIEEPKYIFPEITSFTATPSSIIIGSNTTLSWTSINANRAIITKVGEVSPSGSITITPDTYGMYVLTVYSSTNHTYSASITVTSADPIEPYGRCGYSPGAGSYGTVCKYYSECLSLPGGRWLGEECK